MTKNIDIEWLIEEYEKGKSCNILAKEYFDKFGKKISVSTVRRRLKDSGVKMRTLKNIDIEWLIEEYEKGKSCNILAKEYFDKFGEEISIYIIKKGLKDSGVKMRTLKQSKNTEIYIKLKSKNIDIEWLIEEYEKGKSCNILAKEYFDKFGKKISVSTVRRRLKDSGVKMRTLKQSKNTEIHKQLISKNIDSDRIEWFVEGYEKGKSCNILAKEYFDKFGEEINSETIRRRLKDSGVKIRTAKESMNTEIYIKLISGENNHGWITDRTIRFLPYGPNFNDRVIRNSIWLLQGGRDLLDGSPLISGKKSHLHHIDGNKSNDNPINFGWINNHNHGKMLSHKKKESYIKILKQNREDLENGKIPKTWTEKNQSLFRQENLIQISLYNF